MSKFSELSKKIQKSGKSKKSADAITYAIGKKKYGKAGMAAKAKAGKRKLSTHEKSVADALKGKKKHGK